MKNFGKIFIIALLSAICMPLYAVNDSIAELHLIHGLALDFRPGAVIHSNKFLSGYNELNKSVDASFGMHLKYRFSFGDETEGGLLRKGAYQGVGFSANTFCANKLVGNPFGIYLFQGAPVAKLSSKLTLGYEWNFGVATGWRKYDVETSSLNIALGSSTTAYINIGLLFNYALTRGWQVNAGVEFTHYSNGNTSWPNAGVNTVSARVGVAYLFNNHSENRGSVQNDTFKPYWSMDVMAFAAPRKKAIQLAEEPQLLPGSFLVSGINVAPMYNFNRYLAVGVSVDAQYNESAGLKKYWVPDTYGDDVKFYRPPFHKQISAGLSARVEFIMPIFTINAGIGRYLIGPAETRRTYQTLNLKTFIAKGIYLNVGYQLTDFKYPENLKLGVGYRFRIK